MLTDARRENRVTVDHLVKALEHVLRLDELTRPIIVVRMILFHLVQMSAPRREILPEAGSRCEQIRESGLRVPNVTPVHRFDLAELCEINIDMGDGLCGGSPLFRFSCNTIVEA